MLLVLFLMVLPLLPWLIGIPLGIIKLVRDTATQARINRLAAFEAQAAHLEEENAKPVRGII
jgi:hypothetical protein